MIKLPGLEFDALLALKTKSWFVIPSILEQEVFPVRLDWRGR